MDRYERADAVVELARDQDGVLSRSQLRDLGISRHEVKREVEAGRWRLLGTHTVAVVPDLGKTAHWWRAVWESGQAARLDGASALIAAGLQHWAEDTIHVSMPRGSHSRRVEGVRIHAVRDLEDAGGASIPTTDRAIAAIRAAQWARSDRAAATLLTMSVQQRVVAPDRLALAWKKVQRSRRRVLLDVVLQDICDGAQSLNELDFAGMCRARGLPAPSRQVVRNGPQGRVYLDVAWEQLGVVVEIDGAHHGWGLNAIEDALRDNSLIIDGTVALRIPVIGLRLDPEPFLDQVEAVLRSAEERQKVRAS